MLRIRFSSTCASRDHRRALRRTEHGNAGEDCILLHLLEAGGGLSEQWLQSVSRRKLIQIANHGHLHQEMRDSRLPCCCSAKVGQEVHAWTYRPLAMFGHR